MKLSEVAKAANNGNLASGAFNVREKLRLVVLPEFFVRVSDATWRRKVRMLSVVPPERQYDLPLDFHSMVSVGVAPHDLKYIGEDDALVMTAELNQTPSRAWGYYIVHDTENKLRAIKFDAIPDMEYTIPYCYRTRLVINNDADDVELDPYIPEDFQRALIHGLKREIHLDRFGPGNPTYQAEAQKFEQIIEELKEGAHDLARRNKSYYSD